MLTKVEVTNNQGAVLTLPVGEAVDGFFIKDIDGLDPVKATIVSSGFANQDGELYQASRREKRNIVSKLGLEFGPRTGSIRDLRKQLYNFFMPKTQIQLRFIDDEDPSVYILGRVETCDAPLFVQNPEATISLLCFDPDFFDPTIQQISATTTSDTSEFGMIYEGTTETGFIFTLNVDRSLDEVTIYSRTPDGVLTSLQFIAPLVAGDVLQISTVSGSKWAKLTRAGSTGSILYGVSPYANWINLFPGENHLRVYAEGAGIPYTIEYTNKFGGL